MTAAGAVPPLEYQIAHVDSIVLSMTVITGGSVTHRVQEVWKGDLEGARIGRALALDTRMHELLGYTPVNGRPVVLFLTSRDASLSPLEVLPAVAGSILYAPHDASVQERLTIAQLKARVVAAAT